MSQLTDMIPEVAPEYHALLAKTASAIQEDPFRDQILKEMDSIIKKAEALVGMDKVAIAAPASANNLNRLGELGMLGGAARKANAAGLGPVGKGVATAFAAMTVGGIAMALAGDMYESAKRGLTRGRDYKNMLEANPDLTAASKSAKVKANFSTLHRFNPEFAADPNVAGSYVRNSIDMPGGELASLKDLVKARSDSSKSKQLPSFNPSSFL